MNIDKLISDVQEQFGWRYELKTDQKNIISSVLNKKHTVAVKSTGYGKSLTYLLPPLILDARDGIVSITIDIFSIMAFLNFFFNMD